MAGGRSEGRSLGRDHQRRGGGGSSLQRSAGQPAPVGVVRIDGEFQRGDVVPIVNERRQVVGYGRAEQSSETARSHIGQRNRRPVPQPGAVIRPPEMRLGALRLCKHPLGLRTAATAFLPPPFLKKAVDDAVPAWSSSGCCTVSSGTPHNSARSRAIDFACVLSPSNTPILKVGNLASPRCVIMAPTCKLVAQIGLEAKKLCHKFKLATAAEWKQKVWFQCHRGDQC